MQMDYEYIVNGEKRMITPEESQLLLDRLMEGLGYEKNNKEKSAEKEKPVLRPV